MAYGAGWGSKRWQLLLPPAVLSALYPVLSVEFSVLHLRTISNKHDFAGIA